MVELDHLAQHRLAFRAHDHRQLRAVVRRAARDPNQPKEVSLAIAELE
jgi:hypothetical protein